MNVVSMAVEPHYTVERKPWLWPGFGIFGRIVDDAGQEIVVTLEPGPGGGSKLKGPIPDGTYIAERYFSPKHGRTLWRLNNVPGFEEIEHHVGCLQRDTDGCTLIGTAYSPIQYADMDHTEPGISGSKNALMKWHTETQHATRLHLTYRTLTPPSGIPNTWR
jgi:hypothetical protein